MFEITVPLWMLLVSIVEALALHPTVDYHTCTDLNQRQFKNCPVWPLKKWSKISLINGIVIITDRKLNNIYIYLPPQIFEWKSCGMLPPTCSWESGYTKRWILSTFTHTPANLICNQAGFDNHYSMYSTYTHSSHLLGLKYLHSPNRNN